MMRARLSGFWIATLTALATATLGCAQITYGSPEVSDTVLRTRQVIQASGQARGALQQTGTKLRVVSTDPCDLVQVREIRRTTRLEATNEAAVPEALMFGIGLIPAGLGTGFLVDAKNVYPNDRNARLYNTSGPTGAAVAGAVLATWGAVLMTVPVVDFVRSIGSKEEVTTVTEVGSPLQKDVPCTGGVVPTASKPVMGRVPSQQFTLGTTDAQGRFEVDLLDSIPFTVIMDGTRPESMDVLIGNSVIGTANLEAFWKAKEAIVRKQEESAWAKVDVEGCKEKGGPHCSSVMAFLNEFPKGEHADYARRLLDPAARQASVQVAISPEDVAKAEAAKKAAALAAEAAKKAAEEACRKKCEAACKKDAECSKGCVEEACL